MTCKKQVMKIEEKRGLAMGMARMLKNDGKKTMRMIEWEVESAEAMQDRSRQKTVNRTQDSTALHPRHKRDTGAIVSLSFKVRSIRKYEDTEEGMAEAPDRRKTTAKNQTELQIKAPTEGTTKRSEEWLRKTGEFIISAIGLRKSGLFPFVKRDRGLGR